MSTQGPTTNTTTNKTTALNPIVQPYLGDVLNQAQSLYKSGAGSGIWQGPNVAQLNPTLQSTIDQLGASGLTPEMRMALSPVNSIASGQTGINTGGMYGDLYNRATTQNAGNAGAATALGLNAGMGQTAADRYLTDMAGAKDVNPYLKAQLEDQSNTIANRINSQFSGAGRYGSFGQADALGRTLTAANAPILAGAFENSQNRALNATQAIDQARAQATGLGLQGLGLGASIRQGDTGLGLNAASGLSNVQGQNINNQLAASTLGLNTLSQGTDRALGIGGMLQGRQQAELDAQKAAFAQEQGMPWTNFAKYVGATSGLAPFFAGTGTTTGTENKQTEVPWWQIGLGALQGGKDSSAATAMAMLSDRTEKTDIKKLGQDSATGLDIYAYRYKGDPKSYPKVVGPMAQDIEKKFPGSTAEVGGKLYIKPEFGLNSLGG